VNIGEQESLIVINRAVFKELPGVNIVPLAVDRAFLAEPGCGIGDLENAVVRRLEDPAIGKGERPRSIIVVERVGILPKRRSR